MKCPYCKSDETQVIFQAIIPTILSACPPEQFHKVRLAPFEATLCRSCCLGFNSKPLSDSELKDIYEHYLYISPSSGIGTTKYLGMLETIQKLVAKNAGIAEIGCSEGYLLKGLQEKGYANLLGFEPGPQADIAASLGIAVRKEFFSPETIGTEVYDVFILMHVFEHFEKPWEILKTLKGAMSPQGQIIIEVPNFTGFHHQHLFFFHPRFFRKMGEDLGLKITWRAIYQDALQIVLTHRENAALAEVQIADSFDEMLQNSVRHHGRFQDNVKKLTKIFQDHQGKDLYWWGAGSLSIIYLNQIPQDLQKSVNLQIMDGDKKKWHCQIPGTSCFVRPFGDFQGKSLGMLIIGSSFADEIRKTMESFQITAEKVEVFT